MKEHTREKRTLWVHHFTASDSYRLSIGRSVCSFAHLQLVVDSESFDGFDVDLGDERVSEGIAGEKTLDVPRSSSQVARRRYTILQWSE